MVAQYPTAIYTERETENLPGIVYDANKKTNLFSEDFQRHAEEIIAIETALGVDMENIPTGEIHNMPNGGNTGQVLAKIDVADYNTEWIDPPSGGGAVDSVNGQTGIVVLDAGDVGAEPIDGKTRDIVIDLSSADIKAMYATPIVVIPAQGVGTLIVVDSVLFSFIYNSVKYASGGTVYLKDAGNASVMLTNIALTTVIQGAVNTIRQTFSIVSTLVRKGNSNVTLSNLTGAYITGNSTAKLYIRYHVVTL